jgi:hypothetical protein
MACHQLGPRVWLSVIIFGFGIITLCTAFIENYAGLVVCRLLLGVCESGVQPGIVYAYSQFYRRHEMTSRLGLKAVGASIARAFGRLLGSGLGRIPPHGILTSWRWIFLIEGALTVLLAGVVFTFMPRDVENSKFLTDDEREIACRRISEENMSTDDEGMGLQTFKKALWNINTQMVAVALIMSLLSLTSLLLFLVSALYPARWRSCKEIRNRYLTCDPITAAHPPKNKHGLQRNARPAPLRPPLHRRRSILYKRLLPCRLIPHPRLHPPRFYPHHNHWIYHPSHSQIIERPLLRPLPRHHRRIHMLPYPALLGKCQRSRPCGPRRGDGLRGGDCESGIDHLSVFAF